MPAAPGALNSGDTVISVSVSTNLEELLRFGGTIELAVRFLNADSDDLTLESLHHRYVITEIM